MNPASAKLLMFWDYDTQWGAERSRIPGGAQWCGEDEFKNTNRILELHAQYGMRACFAVIGVAALPGERPYHNPAQIRRIHEAGHEVASHSMYHEWLPGLDRRALLKTLKDSKDSLEQCIGAPVLTFVPPYNQPRDYPARWSFSLSERSEAGPDRTDLHRLCVVLRETGYRFCRISYRPLHLKLIKRLLSGWLDPPGHLENIAGIVCVRTNTRNGFHGPVLKMLNKCISRGGILVVHAHPHSFCSGNPQDQKWFVPFLTEVKRLRSQGLLKVCLPRELL